MRQKRLKIIFLALSLACVLAIVFSIAVPACARQETNNSTGAKESLPVSYTLGSLMDAHEQDIKERMFEYKYEAATDDPSAQVRLLKERNDELKSNTASKKSLLLSLMNYYDLANDTDLTLFTDEMNVCIDMVNGMSNKLLDHAYKLEALNSDDTFKDSLRAIIEDIKNTRKLASDASIELKDKGNSGNKGNFGNNDNTGKKK